MREYRFYSIGKDGHILGPPTCVTANDDVSAVKEAKRMQDGHDIEIWQGANLVAYIVPYDEK